jgi:hypothetical protein
MKTRMKILKMRKDGVMMMEMRRAMRNNVRNDLRTVSMNCKC